MDGVMVRIRSHYDNNRQGQQDTATNEENKDPNSTTGDGQDVAKAGAPENPDGGEEGSLAGSVPGAAGALSDHPSQPGSEHGGSNHPSNPSNPNASNSNSRPGSSAGRPPLSGAGTPVPPGRDWDNYSTDSLYTPTQRFPPSPGPDPNGRHHDVVTESDLYKYHDGGVEFGGGVDEERRARLITEAIQALMAPDDD
jgi:hypothetical protein